MKTAEIHLPYYKQGDDLGAQLETYPVPEALEIDAQLLDEAARILRSIKELIADIPVNIQADTHMIVIDGPDELIDKLIAAGLAEIPEWDDDEEDYEDHEEDLEDNDPDDPAGNL